MSCARACQGFLGSRGTASRSTSAVGRCSDPHVQVRIALGRTWNRRRRRIDACCPSPVCVARTLEGHCIRPVGRSPSVQYSLASEEVQNAPHRLRHLDRLPLRPAVPAWRPCVVLRAPFPTSAGPANAVVKRPGIVVHLGASPPTPRCSEQRGLAHPSSQPRGDRSVFPHHVCYRAIDGNV